MSMRKLPPRPSVYHVLRRDAERVHRGPTGEVGALFSGSGFEVVWVSKKEEAIDRRWFSLPTTDLLLVILGKLRVDFQDSRFEPLVLEPGDFFRLPPRVKCRAYRWPRTSRRATVFLAIYPVRPKSRQRPRSGARHGG